jgi:hypothetical protein
MPYAEFEPAIPVSERPQTHALDRAATAIGSPPSDAYEFSDQYLRLV